MGLEADAQTNDLLVTTDLEKTVIDFDTKFVFSQYFLY